MLRTPIIPSDLAAPSAGNGPLDLKAVAVFTALGFFLDTDTYYEQLQTMRPGFDYEVGSLAGTARFKWHSSPRDISFEQTLEEFGALFEEISLEGIGKSRVILPLSGGLDSRSQAAALKSCENVQTYSYGFEDSFGETRYGKRIAEAMGWAFKAYSIPRGYLWDRIEHLAVINGCYSEFTHPRQMAIFDEFDAMGDLFHLGHWGDVLFDDMGVPDGLSHSEQLEMMLKKVVKKGGLELGRALWAAWGLEGDFEEYLRSRVENLLNGIDIDNANARIRAFKSLYWAPRWTSVNLSVFADRHPIKLPYYDDRMCEFICTVPEQHLAGRRIQIEYIKRVAPELARIPWQTYDPCDLYNYEQFRSAKYVPLRASRKAGRILREKVLRKPLIQRNWELQFLGEENDQQLRRWLFENEKLSDWVPICLIEDFYQKFQTGDQVWYSHPVSALLTLSLFAHKNL